jgi:hypothetical protein
MRTFNALTRWLGIIGGVTVVGALTLKAATWVTVILAVAPFVVLTLILPTPADHDRPTDRTGRNERGRPLTPAALVARPTRPGEGDAGGGANALRDLTRLTARRDSVNRHARSEREVRRLARCARGCSLR